MANLIKCPHCGKDLELTDAFRHEIEEKITLETRLKLEKEFSDRSSIEIEDLKKSLEEKNKQVDSLRDQELELRQQKRKLEDKEKEIELELQRKLDEQKRSLEEQILKNASEQHRLKDLEKESTISKLKEQLEDALRRANQGSQQLQGEVLELDLEKLLKEKFSNDEILPVGKGIRGADIKHVVKSQKGFICGVILWEMKQTKSWSDGWVSKLKEDLRSEKANVPVIVTTVLPKEVEKGLGLYKGIWISDFGHALVLVELLRKNLIDVAYQKFIQQQQGGKADLLYDYFTGHEFLQQIEAQVEVYEEMRMQIEKERRAMESIWKARENQVKRLEMSASSIYGSTKGIIGSSMPQVKGLDLMELESGQEG